MIQTALFRKLRLQAGQRVLILNAPAGYVDGLGDLPDDVELRTEANENTFDFVHLFVKNSAELAALIPGAMEAIRYDGMLWVSYPKKSAKVETDLSRNMMWELMANTGWRPVAQVSIDDIWSALRFRPSEAVNAKS